MQDNIAVLKHKYLQVAPLTFYGDTINGKLRKISFGILTITFSAHRHPSLFRISFISGYPEIQLFWCLNIDSLGMDIDAR